MAASSITTTIRHAAAVQGFHSAPPSSLIVREIGARKSDMFCLPVRHEELSPPRTQISMADYHMAFLTSPLFSMELALLQRSGMTPPETVTLKHLEEVAHGHQNSFALWTLLHEETIPNKSSTIIMRAVIPDRGPFCDTWWSIEHHNDHDTLVFGTSLIAGQKKNARTDRIVDPFLRMTEPLHRLYSRLLLASAKDTLLTRQQEK